MSAHHSQDRASQESLPGRLDQPDRSGRSSSSPEHSSAGPAQRAPKLVPFDSFTATAWRRRREERHSQPFPSWWRRVRSAVELTGLIVVLGAMVAGLLGALLVATVLVGSHLVGG